MEFDSPEAAKEFPGLYMADSGKTDDALEYSEDADKKKSKKEKKKDKDKGYSTLAAESSQDEDDPHDPKSPGKGMKIKAFSKLSGKKKDKDKKPDKAEKELTKKAEKEAKEKRKSEERERKSAEKELNSTPSSSAPRPQIPFSGAILMRSSSQHQSSSLTPQSSIDLGTPVKRNIFNESKESTPSKPLKEKSAAFNVFLNAPAPLLSKLKDKDKDKDHGKEKSSKKEHKDKEKKHKEKDKDKEKVKSESKLKKEKEHKEKEKKDKDHSHASGMAKVKLKLMRSKNSLEEPNDVPHITSHQFPEDPESLAKEIKKYEGLLEQAHLQLKSTKKISKKQEEQLWELQRTLTQLKRKLRSINALSCSSAHYLHHHSQSIDRAPPEPAVSPVHPIFKKCDSVDGRMMAKRLSNNNEVKSDVKPVTAVTAVSPPLDNDLNSNSAQTKEKEIEASAPAPSTSVPKASSNAQVQAIPKIPMPPSKNSYTKSESGTFASSPPRVTSPPLPPPQSQQSSSSNTNNEVANSNTNGEVFSATSVSPVNICVVPDSNSFASPRPSIDTIVQVHRTSMNDLSDTDEPPDAENDAEDSHNDESSKRRSISNESPEEPNESIEAVLDDANKMIGSMHEELMFENSMETLTGDGNMKGSERIILSSNKLQEDSELELFNNDLELDSEATLPNEDPCLDPFSMPIFDTAEYLAIENEALSIFNEQLKDDIQREQVELEETLQKSQLKIHNQETESQDDRSSPDEIDMTDLIAEWRKAKSENDALWDNVNRLRHAVAACKVDEFRLQTRLNYVESKSPATITTPLQTEP